MKRVRFRTVSRIEYATYFFRFSANLIAVSRSLYCSQYVPLKHLPW